jgi:hypothetical protein
MGPTQAHSLGSNDPVGHSKPYVPVNVLIPQPVGKIL